jgi:hypothetical protein
MNSKSRIVISYIRSATPWAALVASAAMAACSSKTLTPDAFVQAMVGSGAQCSSFGAEVAFMNIGGETNLKSPTTVPSGTGNVNIQCSVVPSGSNFTVSLGAQGGGSQIAITGTASKSGGTMRLNIASNTQQAAFVDKACTLSYEYANSPVSPTSQEINPGEIWGHLTCTMAVQQGGAENEDGSDVTCNADVDFLFTNCDDGS